MKYCDSAVSRAGFMMAAIHASFQRIRVIVLLTVIESTRRKLVGFVACAGILMLLSALVFEGVHLSGGGRLFVLNAGVGISVVFGSVLAVFLGAHAFHADMETRVAHSLLSRPVQRWEYLTGKLCGVGLVHVFFLTVMGLLLTGLIWWSHVGWDETGAGDLKVLAGGLWVFLALQSINLTLLSAMTLTIAVWCTGVLFALGMGFAFLVIGHFQHLVAGTWEQQEAGIMRFAGSIVRCLFPDFQVFHMLPLHPSEASALLASAGFAAVYGLGYIGLFLATGCALFAGKEL